MRRSYKALACLLVCVGLAAGNLYAEQGAVVSFPYFGDVGIKNEGGKYTVALGSWGTWAAKGHFNSKKDYKLTTAIPVDNFIGYIPVAGQVLGVLGLSTVELTLQPTGVTYSMICESGGLGLLRGTVTDALAQVPGLGMVVDKVISGMEIRSLVITGAVISKNLKGKISGELAIIGKTVGFSGEGDLSLQGLVNVIVDKAAPAVADYAAEASKAVYREAKDAARVVGQKSNQMAGFAFDQARQGANNVTNSVKHSTHKADKCLNECVPNYANKQRFVMRDNANKAIEEFANSVRDKVITITGGSEEETARLRGEQFRNEWIGLVNALDDGWQKIYDDREVDNYFFKDDMEQKGRARFRELIAEAWNQHRDFRDASFNGIVRGVNYRLARAAKNPQLALVELQFYAKASVPVTICMKSANLAFEVVNTADGKYSNGAELRFGSLSAKPSQQWILVPAGTGPNTYHLRSVQSGRFIHIAGAADARGSNLVTWDGASAAAKQTIFTVSADPDGTLRIRSQNGFSLDLENGSFSNGSRLRLWDRNGSIAQAFYVSPADVYRPARSVAEVKAEALARLARLAGEGAPVTFDLKLGSSLAVDLEMSGNDAPNGNNVSFYTIHRRTNQQWQLVPTGRPNVYNIRSKASGKFIHIDSAKDVRGQSLKIWEGAGPDVRQACFTAAADDNGYIHFLSQNGFAWDIFGGAPRRGADLGLWDNHWGDGQAFSVNPVR